MRLFLILLTLWIVSCTPKTYVKTELGIKATIDSTVIEVQFFSPEIVRVVKSKQGYNYEKKSLCVISRSLTISKSVEY